MEFQHPLLYQGIDVQNFEASASGRKNKSKLDDIRWSEIKIAQKY